MKMSTSYNLAKATVILFILLSLLDSWMHLIIIFICTSLLMAEIKHLKLSDALCVCEVSFHLFPWFTVEMVISFILRALYV